MSRTLTSAMQTVATADVVRPITLVELEFDGGSSLFWSGFGDLSWDSKTWTGAGTLMTIGGIEESSELKAIGTNISLSGLPSDIVSLALTEDYQGRGATIYLGALDESGDVIADPVIVFSGRMDVMSIEESGDTAQINISIENRLIDFERTKVRRYTDQDQKIDYPSDKGFEFVVAIQNKELTWGKS